MITTQQLIESLKVQTECPKCGVSFKELEDSLHEGMDSENYQIAQMVINNCPVCQWRFEEMK